MAKYNISITLNTSLHWKGFQTACTTKSTHPNTVLRRFIEHFAEQVLGSKKKTLEHEIAEAMAEAKSIAKGKRKAKKAASLLKEL